jgi:hypothetical protein
VEYVPTKIGEAAYGNIRLGEKDAQLLRAAAPPSISPRAERL